VLYCKVIFEGIGMLIKGTVGLSDMSGAIGAVSVMDEVYTEYARYSIWDGISSILSIASLISVNLGIFNLIPIPALDGSKILICAWEGIRKKPVNKKVEMGINLFGFVLIIALAILTAVMDISKLVL